MCQSLSSFFRLENRNWECDLWGYCHTEMSKEGSLTGLFSVEEYQYKPFCGFKSVLFAGDKTKVPFCQTCQRPTDKDLIIISTTDYRL